MDGTADTSVELDRVLFIADGDRMTIGTPAIEGAKVLATHRGEEKGDKIIVFRYKAKVRYRNKTGHRTIFTKLSIDKIVEPGTATEAPAKKVRRSKKEVTESGT